MVKNQFVRDLYAMRFCLSGRCDESKDGWCLVAKTLKVGVGGGFGAFVMFAGWARLRPLHLGRRFLHWSMTVRLLRWRFFLGFPAGAWMLRAMSV